MVEQKFETKSGSDSDIPNDGYISLSDLAGRYGYTEYHIRRLARTGRIQAARYGTKGEWRIDEASLERYHKETTQRRFNEQKASTVPFPILSASQKQNRGSSVSLPSQNLEEIGTESSLNAEIRRDLPSVSDGRGSSRGTNAIPRILLILVGGILFLINFVPAINFDFDFNFNKTPMAGYYEEAKDNLESNIFSPLRQAQGKLRQYLSTHLFPQDPTQTYLTIDPHSTSSGQARSTSSGQAYDSLRDRVGGLEKQISNFRFPTTPG